MTASIVPQLIRKDLRLMKIPTLLWWCGGLLSVIALMAGASFLVCFIFFVTAMAGAGMHAVMQTVVEERRDKVLPFVMSLPITVREYTTAKIAANLAIFLPVWLTLSAMSYVIFVDAEEGMARGKLPFVTIVLVGILLAYTVVLATSLITESIGWSITAMVGANILTQSFLWWAVDLEGIRSLLESDVVVWSATAWTILIAQVAIIVALILLTHALQARKTDFL